MNADKFRETMNRIEEVKRIHKRNEQHGREAMLSLLRRYGKRQDEVGMSVRVAAYHMGVSQ